MEVKFNKKGKMTAVIAVRSGSERVPNKNIRSFSDTNLLELKLNVLTRCEGVDEIIVNSDSEEMLNLGKQYKVMTQLREPYFASSEATNSEFHKHIGETTNTDFIFLAPVCSPFVSSGKHDEAIKKFYEIQNDSLTSTNSIKGHLWLDGKPINYSLDNVPNSQDLPNIQMLNYGISIIEREKMINNSGLIGDNPSFFNLNYIESIDINTIEEYELAVLIYTNELVGKLY